MLTRLLILWLLSERSHHGYSIKKILADPTLSIWFPIDYASIYSMLRSLVKEGNARKVVTEKAGNRPKRTVFEITPQGRKRYADLLRDAWKNPVSPTDNIQIALGASGDLPEQEVVELSNQRLNALKIRLKKLNNSRTSAPDEAMVEREVARIKGEISWLKSWIAKQT